MGVAVSEDGAEQGGMGVAVGDYDNSGRFSLFKTNFSEEYNDLYHNDGDHFTDVSFRSKTAPSSLPYVGWGTAFLDYDDDGLLDIIAVNGHVYPQLDKARLGASAPYRQRRLLYHNRGDGTFDEVSAEFGPVLTEKQAINEDILFASVRDLGERLRTRRLSPVALAEVYLDRLEKIGPRLGAVVTVRAGGRRLMRLVRSGTGYLSQDDMRAHFGLGAAAQADSIEVRWPDGTSSRMDEVRADRLLEIDQPR